MEPSKPYGIHHKPYLHGRETKSEICSNAQDKTDCDSTEYHNGMEPAVPYRFQRKPYLDVRETKSEIYYNEHDKTGYNSTEYYNATSIDPPPLPARRRAPSVLNTRNTMNTPSNIYGNTDDLHVLEYEEPVSTPRKPFYYTDEEKTESDTHEYDYIPDYTVDADRPYPKLDRQSKVNKSEDENERPTFPKRPPLPKRPPTQAKAERIISNDSDQEAIQMASLYDYTVDADRLYPKLERQTYIKVQVSEDANERPALPKRPPPPTRSPQAKAEKIKSYESDQEDIQMANFYGRREENEIRIVMVGRTGSGKSATGNTIMSKPDHFESKLTGTSVTRECKRGESSDHGRKLVVIDTPGLFDTKVSYEKISKEIIRCVNLSTPGPHAFLLVLQIARFTDEEIETFNRLFDLFGEGMGSFAIITFTKLDDLEAEGGTVEDYIKTAPEKLKFFLNRCNGNYIAINNKASEKTKSLKVKELIQLIDKIKNKNGGRHYSNEMYKEAEAALQRKIKEIEKQKALEKKKEIEKIESKFVGQIDSMKKENKELAKQVSSQENLQRQAKRDKEKADTEIRRMKEEIKKIDRKRNEELYRIKQQEKQEKEKQARLLEEKERQYMKIVEEMKMKHEETTKNFDEMEKRKNEELAKVTKTFNKRMAEETQRLIECIKVKDDTNKDLQKKMSDQISEMKTLIEDRDSKILQQQLDHQKKMTDAKTALTKERTTQQNARDEQDRRHREDLDRLDKRLRQEIQKNKCRLS